LAAEVLAAEVLGAEALRVGAEFAAAGKAITAQDRKSAVRER